MPRRQIAKEELHQVAVLKASGASPTRISKATGLHHGTVKRLLESDAEVHALIEDAQHRIGAKFEALCERVLDSVNEEDLLKASLQQKSIAAATMLDKARLVRGQATNISLQQIFNLHVEARNPLNLREDEQAIQAPIIDLDPEED